MPCHRLIYFLLLSCGLLTLNGCIRGKTPPAQFYLLEPISRSGSSDRGLAEKPVIALGPVRIPRYIDRPQIVTATAKNAYQLSELHRWAESLDDNILRVLAQNLNQLASANTVLASGSNRGREAKLRVSVTILEFHVDPQGQAGLTAQWQITGAEQVQQSRQVAYHLPASTTDYRVMVTALNDCLNQMSRELAEALRLALAEGRKP
ncbi:MAG: PqiC family protein [Methylomicrobium sp.]